MSPFIAWWDAARGTMRPFGTEWSWHDAPVGPEMLAAIVSKMTTDRAHEWGKLTPTTLLASPRQVIIERFMDCFLDPEQAVSMQIGTMVHEGLVRELKAIGYSVDPLKLNAYGAEMEGSPDAYWAPYKLVPKMTGGNYPGELVPIKVEGGPIFPDGWETVANPKPFAGMPDIIELKVTTPGSVKFIMQDGRPKRDHRAQVNLYRAAFGKTFGCDPESLSAVIRYYDMPQKEQVVGMGWVRMPPCLSYPVEYMDLEEIGDIRPGYDPPVRSDKGYQGPPPPMVKENAATLIAAIKMIEAGAKPEDVVKGLECHCPKRFQGQGRNYCNVSGVCAMLDHGVPVW